MSEHTPGPWEWDHETGILWSLVEEERKHEVVRPYGSGDGGDLDNDYTEDDARLIAKAPEMYDCLNVLANADIARPAVREFELIQAAKSKALKLIEEIDGAPTSPTAPPEPPDASGG
jgi:hypothetical protein